MSTSSEYAAAAAKAALPQIPGVEQEQGECFKTSFGHVRIYKSADEIPGLHWASCFSNNPRDHRYHEISAEALEGQFDHRYAVMWNERNGKAAVQPVFFVDQDILEGLPAKLRAVLAFPRRFYPRWLKLRMLVAGCSAGDGVLGSTEPWAVDALSETLLTYGRKNHAPLLLMKDFPSTYREALKPFQAAGFLRVPSMPGCELELDFKSFDEFMTKKLTSKLRTDFKRKFKKLSQHSPIALEVIIDPTPVVGELCALYKNTHLRSKMRFECLTEEFFVQIARRMPDRARYFIWRHEGRIVGFALCLVHEGTIYHLNVGFDYQVALDLHLYFVGMRDVIQWAAEQGLKHYSTGQLNYDPKYNFRMKLAPLDLYVRHTSSFLNRFFKLALPFLQPVRHEPILRKFANAADL